MGHFEKPRFKGSKKFNIIPFFIAHFHSVMLASSINPYVVQFLSIFLHNLLQFWYRLYMTQTSTCKDAQSNSKFMTSPCGIVVNMLDCNIVVSQFKLQLPYHIHFQTNTLRKSMKPFILSLNERVYMKERKVGLPPQDGCQDHTTLYQAQ